MKTARALSPDPDDGDTLFFDVIFLALAGFVVVTVLLLLHLNPPLDDEQDTRAPGSVIFELRWPDESRADVDLWVMGPDGAAVWTHPGKVEAPYTVCIASASNLTGLVKSGVECRRTGL